MPARPMMGLAAVVFAVVTSVSAEDAPGPTRSSVPTGATTSIDAPATIGRTAAEPVADDSTARARTAALMEKMRLAVRTTTSSHCRFHQHEWIEGMQPPSLIEQKARKNGDVYMRWVEGPVAGRELLYRPTMYDGKLLVKHGIFPAITVDPRGFLARQGNRHTVHEAGVVKVAERILVDHDLIATLPPEAARYEDLGERDVHGVRAVCWRAVVDKDRHPALYAHQIDICVDPKTGLPVTIRAHAREGGAVRLVEDYAFTGCKLNTLTDADFDEENPDYAF